MPHPKIMILAGEASGDAHGAKLVTQLRHSQPDIEVFGMGSDQLRAAGMDIVVDSRDLGVVGFVEIFKVIKKIRHAFKVVKRTIRQRRPDVVVLIDYPGFNLRMAKYAKKQGCKVLYYISPQLWAWRQSRVKIIQRAVDSLAVILPFEVDFYRKHRVQAHYVGHPLLSDLDQLPSRQQARSTLNIKGRSPIITLCPGSRRSELHYLGETLQEVAKRLHLTYPNGEILVPMAPTLDEEDYAPLGKHVRLLREDFYTVIAASDVTVAASGTATLQIALTTTPMVIIYKGNWISYQLAKWLVKVPAIGLCNLVAGKKIVRELIQDDANPDEICTEVNHILHNSSYQTQMVTDLMEMTEQLSRPPDGPSIDQLTLSLLKEH